MNTQAHADPALSIVCLAGSADRPVGVGFLIGAHHILTCAHVVNAALGRDPRSQDAPSSSDTVVVKFPTISSTGEISLRYGHVTHWHPPPAQPRFEFGDIACLVLDRAKPAEAVPAIVGVPASEPALQALVFGYPSDPPRPEGAWVRCEVAPGVGGGFLQLAASSASGLRAQPGYSGSPVWLQERGVVVGMLAIAPSGGESRDAYAIPARDFASIYRSISGSDPLPPPRVTELRRACTAVSDELAEWRRFISSRADLGWINYGDEIPAVSAWREYGDSLAQAASESLVNNLKIVYRYFSVLTDAHDQVWSHLKAEASYRNMPNFRDPQAAVAEGLIYLTMFAGYQGAFYWKMRSKQLRNEEFRNRLRSLPGVLRTLGHELDLLSSGTPHGGQRLEAVEVPALPSITAAGRSISFELVPAESSQDFRAAGAGNTDPLLRTGAGSTTSQRMIDLQEWIQRDPGNADAHRQLGQWLMLAASLGRNDAYREAEAAFREAIRLEPGNAAGHVGLGRVLLSLWEPGAASFAREGEAAFREAIRLNPSDPDPHGYLALTLLAQDRHSEAEAACREAVRLSPLNAYLHSLLGDALSRQKRHRDADAAYKEAARLDPALRSQAGGIARIRRRGARFLQ